MHRSSRGFTIVETLIFLAISGVMFIIAFYGMQNQRDNVGFRQALNDIELKIRETFNNVDNGYFGNVGDYKCEVVGGVGEEEILIEPSDGSTGGTSSDCIFLGKIIEFSNNTMTIFTVIGARTDESITNYSEEENDPMMETYEINNSVQWLSNKLYNTEYPDEPLSVSTLKVRAQRSSNAVITAQNDLRATRAFYADGSSDWQNISENSLPMFCFGLGDKRGSIIITQRDLTVDYTGEGCE